ncbi:MAG: AbrB/MazE/SpoVT family DNA-binding domain-containing protein [Candidatus Micrarchaeota archaeon]
MVCVDVRINAKGQVVIPKVFRDAFGFRPNSVAVMVEEGERVFLRPKLGVGEFKRLLHAFQKINVGRVDSDADHAEALESRWTT